MVLVHTDAQAVISLFPFLASSRTCASIDIVIEEGFDLAKVNQYQHPHRSSRH